MMKYLRITLAIIFALAFKPSMARELRGGYASGLLLGLLRCHELECA